MAKTNKKIDKKVEKPRSTITMATDGQVVSSVVKTTREIYMESTDDQKNKKTS